LRQRRQFALYLPRHRSAHPDGLVHAHRSLNDRNQGRVARVTPNKAIALSVNLQMPS
jgi:hypothetical protein